MSLLWALLLTLLALLVGLVWTILDHRANPGAGLDR
jgi:hypothetical protein